MKIREDYICPIEVVTDMLRGKWKTIILWRLRLGPTSLSQLHRDIENVSEKMLLQQLAELIECGFVAKTEFQGYPLKVEYCLSDELGLELLKALTILQNIGLSFTGKDSCEK
ncbi:MULTISPECIES: winged helix-turn-helix transcriptional regulator [unclassified Enterococcus]|uniref:winged helix-turn-helix transcriptional regulator n=1 Tax=unclassified Enterococcus TaxID=2608891 RepID=UPI001CE0BF9E|nr:MULTISPECIES: helix-turn-helix domain-containing protein [unclassified Enterococcus]MCA5013688.1 helix-turn-helix transcriptional regulator [Enterococcus sp. S23]MCA5016938.1 helix-turn-helix transcriptional regulator [Enterococcus sp. S22(2020)]